MYGLKQLILVFLVSLTFSGYAKGDFISFFNEKLATFYKKNVSDNGLVNYSALKKEYGELEELVQIIENFDVNEISEHHKLPYLINVYNISVINMVVQNYPIKSVMDVEDFFDTNIVVGKKEMTLNDLEKKYIFSVYEDAMVHFALVCAAKGCPKLSYQPYQVENLSNLTVDNTLDFLSVADNMTLNGNSVRVSSIFDWYENDFDGKRGVIEFLNMFSDVSIPKSAKVSYSNYDWSLNDWQKKK